MVVTNFNNVSNLEDEKIVKKKGSDLLFYILQNLYKSNFLFFKISFIKLSYEDLSVFLKEYGDKDIQKYCKSYPLDTQSKEEITNLFLWYLAKKIKRDPHFECCLFFYTFDNESVSLEVLLCLKVFSFDSLALLEVYLFWFFKSIAYLIISIEFLISLDQIKDFFYKNIKTKQLSYIYNDLYVYSNYSFISRTTFLYNFFDDFVLNSVITDIKKQPVWETPPVLYYPAALTIIDKPGYMDIIHILTLYLTCKDAFLDVNSGFIYQRLSTSKSTIVYMCSVEELKANFLSICYYLKNFIKKKFIASFEFLNCKLPLLPFDINSNIINQKSMALNLLDSDPLLLQNLNAIDFKVIEFKNGYYVINENTFYSFKLLSYSVPQNELKVKEIVSYSYINRLFSKVYFKKHSFMVFLKNLSKVQKHLYNSLFNVFFNLKVDSTFFYIIKVDIQMRSHFVKFLRQVYYNSPFIFLDLNYMDLTNVSNTSFSKTLPLFIVVDSITEILLKFLYKLSNQIINKPLRVVLIVTSTTDTSSLNSIFFCKEFFEEIFFYKDLGDQIIQHGYSLDLFIILNMFFFDFLKKKPDKKFLDNYKQPAYFDAFDEVDEEWS